jgi:hypothetical protein
LRLRGRNGRSTYLSEHEDGVCRGGNRAGGPIIEEKGLQRLCSKKQGRYRQYLEEQENFDMII